MKIRTVTDLTDELDKDWSWRKKEISNLWNVLQKGRNVSKEAIIRSLIPILYAHFEGFVKQATSQYSNFLFYQKIPLNEASHNIVAIEMKTRLTLGTEAQSPRYMIDLVKDLDQLNGTCTAIKNYTAYTASNLNFERFSDLSLSLGIDISRYETQEHLIDKRLLGLRNNIAHGQYISIDMDQVNELRVKIIEMLEFWKSQMLDIAYSKKFKK